MSNHDLLRRLHDAPFKPFRMRLLNSTAIDVLDPGSVIVGDTSAVVPTETVVDERGYRIARDWKTIAIDHIVEFVDINSRPGRARGQKK